MYKRQGFAHRDAELALNKKLKASSTLVAEGEYKKPPSLSTRPSNAIHPIKFPHFQIVRKFKSDSDRKFAHLDIDVKQRKQVNLGSFVFGR